MLGFLWNMEIGKEMEDKKEKIVGRIMSQCMTTYRILVGDKEIIGQVSGKYVYGAQNSYEYPVVGDYVLVDRDNDEGGTGIITEILERKSAIKRRMAGGEKLMQVLVANVDTVFICMSLNSDYNLRRLERYLTMVYDSGATPVIVLTKSDLCNNIEEILLEVGKVALGVEIVVSSCLSNVGLEILRKYTKEGETISLVGSSGVGKTTIINNLLGENFKASHLGKNHKGRHTTTSRNLLKMKNNGYIIDTPGLREVGIDFFDLSRSFEDIEQLSQGCKFRNCTHTNEPGCQVLKAVASGDISEDRLNSYLKLSKEVKYTALDSKAIEKEKIKEMYNDFQGMKNAKKFKNNKRKY